MSLQEGMRLLPTAGEGTFRVSKQDVRLGNLTVPAGTWNICCGIHYDSGR
jgi:cytochrome P450